MQLRQRSYRHETTLLAHLSLSRVDAATTADLHPAASPVVASSTQDAGQVILIHQVPLLPSLFFHMMSGVLLLIFGKNEIITPVSLTSTLDSSIGASVHRLGDAEAVAAGVPLHVFLQVQLELAVGGRAASHPCECGTTTSGAELLAHLFCCAEAGVAAQDVRLEVLHTLHGRREQVEVNLQEHVLHGEISRQGCDLQNTLR
jgi:hypothetical protein